MPPDRFIAEPVLGPRFPRTRGLLAMTNAVKMTGADAPARTARDAISYSSLRAALTRVGSLVLFVLVWQVAAVIARSPVLPAPRAVGAKLLEYAADGSLFYQSGITLARVVAAFVLAMLLGTGIGIALARRPRVDAFFDSWLVIALNVPALVAIILCYVWFGLTEAAAVLAVSINKIPTVAVIVREGARAVDRELMQVAEAFKLPRSRTFFRVYLPQLVPHLMASARSGLALTWKIVLVVELLGRPNGVGFKLAVFFQFFDIASIFAYSIVFIAVVLAIEMWLLRPLERRLTRWRL
jgi:NitT/TauT family transport system permease protein